MHAIIITIGDEILLGQILDTNARYIAGELTKTGVEVVRKFTIPDKESAIRDTVDTAMKQADIVIVTGGLGPTNDDITKKVLADYFATPLVVREEVLEWLREMLDSRDGMMNERNRSQALLPADCRILRNYKGTASGMWFEKEGKSLVSLPGVPFEMEHLLDEYVIPELKKRYPSLQLQYHMLKVYDIPESQLAVRLDIWESALPEGLSLAYLPSPAFVKLRITAKGEAVNLLDRYVISLKEALTGLSVVEGDEYDVEKEVGALLRKSGATLSLAESCTGGNIARILTSVSGSSAYFIGGVVAYDNRVKEQVLGVNVLDMVEYGVVSETVVKQMAEGVRRVMGTDYAVATSGIAGPNGGSVEKPVGLVWIAVATPSGVNAQKFQFSSNRERNIAKASLKALQMLKDAL